MSGLKSDGIVLAARSNACTAASASNNLALDTFLPVTIDFQCS